MVLSKRVCVCLRSKGKFSYIYKLYVTLYKSVRRVYLYAALLYGTTTPGNGKIDRKLFRTAQVCILCVHRTTVNIQKVLELYAYAIYVTAYIYACVSVCRVFFFIQDFTFFSGYRYTRDASGFECIRMHFYTGIFSYKYYYYAQHSG